MRQPYALLLTNRASQAGRPDQPLPDLLRMKPSSGNPGTQWWGLLGKAFYLDLRSLALMRVVLGLVIVLDICVRASSLKVHYTDAGVMPRYAAAEHFLADWNVSIYMISGHWAVIGLLFLIHAFFGLMFMFGWRTRLATVACWVLAISLQNRNPLVLDSGDMLLRMLLFWGMFLPLGARFSLDRVFQRDRQQPPVRIMSAATMAVISQMIIVYLFIAIQRDFNEHWYRDYTAGMYALHVDHFATRLGIFLRDFPTLVMFLTACTAWLELLGPWLVLVPRSATRLGLKLHVVARVGAIFSLIAMHMSLSFILELGLFSIITSAGWAALLPSEFWDHIKRWMPRARRIRLRFRAGDVTAAQRIVVGCRLIGLRVVRISEKHGPLVNDARWWAIDRHGKRHVGSEAVVAMLLASPWLNWWLGPMLATKNGRQLVARLYRLLSAELQPWDANQLAACCRPLWTRLSIKGNFFVALMLLLVIWWNIATINPSQFKLYIADGLHPVGQVLRIDQRWDMFSPYPMSDDGWYVIEAHKLNGESIDLMTGEDVTWDKPEVVSAMYADTRWRKWMTNMWYRDNSKARLYYAQWLTRHWNDNLQDDERIARFTINYMLEETTSDGPIEPKKVIIWSHDCFGTN